MTQYSRINLVYRLQKWMDSVPGQTFLNYAYSWGAAVVILGTLFKLTHMDGADLMLFLGMGTEVVVFFLSAFDRPFDKTADGMDLPTHLEGEPIGAVVANGANEVFQTDGEPSAAPLVIASGKATGTLTEAAVAAASGSTVASGGTVSGGGQTIIIGGGYGGSSHGANDANGAHETNETESHEPIAFTEGNELVETSAPTSIPPLTPDMTEATNAYVDELKKLTEVLERVSEQSKRLTTDSEEMENLNRTLTGICKVYEMQLKSASSQIGTIDEINEQTRHMAEQIKELNNIYARMIEAMSVRMASDKS